MHVDVSSECRIHLDRSYLFAEREGQHSIVRQSRLRLALKDSRFVALSSLVCNSCDYLTINMILPAVQQDDKL